MIVEVNDTEFVIEEQLQLTKQAYNAVSLNDRTLSTSNEIRILRDNKSNLLFKGNYPLKGGDFTTVYKCKIIDSTVLLDGICILNKVDQDYYYVQIIDKLKILFQEFTESFQGISEADQYDFIFNAQSLIDLHPLDNGSLWVWPYVSMNEIASYENNPESGEILYSRPLLSIDKLLKLMMDLNDWNPIALQTEMCMTANTKSFYFANYEKIISDTYVVVGSAQMTGFDVYDYKNVNITVTSTTVTVGNVAQTKWSIRLRGNYTTTDDMILRINAATSREVFDASIYLLAVNTYVDSNSLDFYTDQGSTFNVTFFLEGTGTIVFQDTRLYTFFDEVEIFKGGSRDVFDFRCKTYDNIQLNLYSIYKSLLQIRGLFMFSEGFSRTVELFYFSQIDKNNSLDWSSRFQQAKQVTGDYIETSKRNYLLYNNDSGVLPTTGEAYFDLVSNYEGSAAVVTVDFSASDDTIINSKAQASIPIYGVDRNSGLESRNTDLNPRIVKYESNGNGVFHPLSFEVGIANYQPLIDALDDQKVYEITAILTQSDFLSFDFTRPVFIKQLHGTFMILSMTWISDNELSVLRLLKM